ncbi:hypothetical protein ABT358_31145 [Streptomyces sp. NPDC000341]|uniref:hypothetical protein n=1 Tax=Streptomyces sp. NPDC000341 TaxID=3156645 RepID=UPI00332160A7
MRLAFAAHTPPHGRITVHPTPLAGTGAYLAHDLIRALGKHLPVPDEAHPLPAWTNNSDRSWRIAASWFIALGITHTTVCRSHRLSKPQWEHLLALSALTGTRLTLLCHGPLPRPTAALLDTIPHRVLDTTPAATTHWSPPSGPPESDNHPWWQHTTAFPPRNTELWFRLPPQPREPFTTKFIPSAEPTGTTPPLPVPGPHQDPCHPHTAQIAARIHTRVAHPVHAACVALRALTGYNSQQIKSLHERSGNGLAEMPAWAQPLLNAARHLTHLQGHPDAPNVLSTPSWEHPEIEQALRACRLLTTPPDRHRTAPVTTGKRRADRSMLRARVL